MMDKKNKVEREKAKNFLQEETIATFHIIIIVIIIYEKLYKKCIIKIIIIKSF